MDAKEEAERIVALLPKQHNVPQHLHNHREYKLWKEETLSKLYPEECAWLSQYSSKGRDLLADMLDEFFPPAFQLAARQETHDGWRYAAEFAMLLLEVIREEHLCGTALIIQRNKGEENLVLVRPVMGMFVGKLPINAGVQN
jgi:hypothetical protein